MTLKAFVFTSVRRLILAITSYNYKAGFEGLVPGDEKNEKSELLKIAVKKLAANSKWDRKIGKSGCEVKMVECSAWF